MKWILPTVSILGLLALPGYHVVWAEQFAPTAADEPAVAASESTVEDYRQSSCCDRCGDCEPACCWYACGCRPGGDYWATAEYLLWWAKGRHLPPLATTSPPDTARNLAGRIGLDDTTIIFGDEDVGGDVQSGGRFTIGAWLDCQRTVGIGGGFFFLEGDSAGFAADSPDGSETIARPFSNIDPLPPFAVTPNANLISYTDPETGPLNGGGLRVRSTMDILGADAFARVMLQNGCGYRVDLVGGYQFSRIDDSLRIDGQWDVLDPQEPLAGTTIAIQDFFDVENQFHGGGVGLLTQVCHRCWTLDTMAKISVGNMRETVNIRGATVLTQPPEGFGTPAPQGLLALDSNRGRFQRDRVGILPEVRVTLACQATSHWDLSIGYSFMYWSHVVLAGDQVDETLNLSQLTGPLIGPARPALRFRDTDFWAQGVHFGACCTF